MLRKVGLNKKVYLLALLALVAVLSLAVASPALAGEYITDNAHAVLNEDEIIDDDLFIAGQTVEVLGTVKGDLFAAGQQVVVSGMVEGNVFAAGQIVTLGGEVDGSAFTAGYAVFVKPETMIARNLYFGGYSLVSAPESMVERNLYGGGYQFKVDGDVGRDLSIGAGAVSVDGFVGGDALVEVGVPAEGQQPSNFNPVFMSPMPPGVIIPTIKVGADISEDNVGGELNIQVNTYNVPEQPSQTEGQPGVRTGAAFAILNRLRKAAGETIALLIVGGLMLAYMFGWTEKVIEQVRSKPFPSLGWGVLVYLLLVPVVMVVFFLLALVVLLLSMVTLGELTGTAISISGLGFGALLTGFGLLAGLVAKVVIAYLVGYLLLEQTSPDTLEGKWGKFLALFIGVVIYELLLLIPVGRIVVIILVTLFGIGAVFSMYWDRYQASRASAA